MFAKTLIKILRVALGRQQAAEAVAAVRATVASTDLHQIALSLHFVTFVRLSGSELVYIVQVQIPKVTKKM